MHFFNKRNLIRNINSTTFTKQKKKFLLKFQENIFYNLLLKIEMEVIIVSLKKIYFIRNNSVYNVPRGLYLTYAKEL